MITFTIGFFLIVFGFLAGFITAACLRQNPQGPDEHESFPEGR